MLVHLDSDVKDERGIEVVESVVVVLVGIVRERGREGEKGEESAVLPLTVIGG